MDFQRILDFLNKYDWLVALFLAPLFWSVAKWVWEKIVLLPISKIWNAISQHYSIRNQNEKFLRKYLNSLINSLTEIPPIGLPDVLMHKPIALEDVFTKVRIADYKHIKYDSDNFENTYGTSSQIQVFSFASIFKKYNRTVILGDPGAGKSTLVSWLVLTYARDLLLSRNAKLADDLVMNRLGIRETSLPVLIRARSLQAGSKLQPDNLLQLAINPALIREIPQDFFNNWLSDGKCLIVIDGLDEMIDLDNRRSLIDTLENFVAIYPKNRFVVTSRIIGYDAAPVGVGFYTFSLQPLNKQAISDYVRRWYTNIRKQHKSVEAGNLESETEQLSVDLLKTIDAHESLRILATNPLLLTAIILLHSAGIKLPQRKAELYNQVLIMMLGRWDEQKRIAASYYLSPEQKINVLSPVGLWLQNSKMTELSKDELLRIIREMLSKAGIDSSEAERFIRDVEIRSGILVEKGAGLYGFSHRSIQEFLTAKKLRDSEHGVDVIRNEVHLPEWYEVILFYSGLGDATNIVNVLLDSPDDILHTNLVFSAQCTIEAMSIDVVVRKQIESRLIELFLMYPEKGWPSLWISCLTSLARLRSYEFLNKIKQELQSDDPQVQEAAIRSFGYLRGIALSEDVVTYLNDENDDVRISAALALQNLADSNAIGRLLDQLNFENDDTVKMMLVRSLEDYGSHSAVHALCRLLKNFPDSEVRLQAAIALRKYLDYEEVIESLCSAVVSDTAEHVREWAADTLSYLDNDEVITLLVNVLLSDPSEWVRQNIAMRLWNFDIPLVKETLYQVLQNDAEDTVRMRAAASLAKLGESRSHEYLYNFVSEDIDSNWMACIGLSYVNTPEAIKLLSKVIKNSEDESLVRTAVHALADLKASNALELLSFTLKNHKDDIVRRDCAYSLGRLGDSSIKQILIDVLKDDESAEVQEAVVYSIGELYIKDCVDILGSVLEEEGTSLAVREAAAASISKIERIKPLTVGLQRNH